LLLVSVDVKQHYSGAHLLSSSNACH